MECLIANDESSDDIEARHDSKSSDEGFEGRLRRHKSLLAAFTVLGLLAIAGSWSESERAAPPSAEALEITQLYGQLQLQPRIVKSRRDGVHRRWVNLPQRRALEKRHSQPIELSSSEALRDGPSARSLAQTTTSECMVRIDRLYGMDVSGSSKIASLGYDPDFAADQSSISEPGANCGDSAAGIYESCSKYNRWETFEDVARFNGKTVQVFGQDGPQYKDVEQGELGTCYLLTAMSSLAHSNPDIISGMFVRRELWAKGIYTTRWLINGKETQVEVDNKIPASAGRPFFVRASSGIFWPAILEKAWSKIYSSFHAAEGGSWDTVIRAATQAPTKLIDHSSDSKEQLWSELLSSAGKAPMAASTGSTPKYGLAGGHAYAVLKARTSAGQKLVKCWNPWNADYYQGSIQNTDRTDGEFEMTFDEYLDAFQYTDVAEVRAGYKTSTYAVVGSALQAQNAAVEFTVASSEDFFVSVVWPGERIIRPCSALQPTVTLAVELSGQTNPETFLGAALTKYVSNTITAQVTAGAGKYVAFAAADFSVDYISEVAITVYAKESVSIVPSSLSPALQAVKLLGPGDCSNVMVSGHGLYTVSESKLMFGMPTYWSHAGDQFLFYYGDDKKWFATGASNWQNIEEGKIYYSFKASKDDFTCGCRDLENGISGFGNLYCSDVKPGNEKYSNVKCYGVEYSGAVQQCCPVTCKLNACTATTSPAPPPPAPATNPPAPPPPASAPSSAPSPSPSPVTGTCEDRSPSGYRINSVPASCSQLSEYCESEAGVKVNCCETCFQKNQDLGLGNDDTCKDQEKTTIKDAAGNILTCSQLGPYCNDYLFVQDACCATCGEQGKVDPSCVDASETGVTISGVPQTCEQLASYCYHQIVADACQKTCNVC